MNATAMEFAAVRHNHRNEKDTTAATCLTCSDLALQRSDQAGTRENLRPLGGPGGGDSICP
jgi:hypothetical protein